MTAICLTRPYSGIGDWLMALACCKFVNRQRPDVQIFVDYTRARALPAFVPQAYQASDVTFATGRPGHAVVTSDSLVYRAYPPVNYIESMVLHLNAQTGLDIAYERRVFPDFGVRHQRDEALNYVVMIGQGKRRERHRKEWGVRNLQALAQGLHAAGYGVVQVGGHWDRRIPCAHAHLLGAPFREVTAKLARARAFVGLENGIMILAGFLGLPQVTIYDGHSIPERTDFCHHLKIPERIEPGAAARKVLAWLAQC